MEVSQLLRSHQAIIAVRSVCRHHPHVCSAMHTQMGGVGGSGDGSTHVSGTCICRVD